MTFIGDFKKFIFRGNVVDLAVGVIIGAAFGKLVTSLVENIMMPPIGCLTGNTDFSHLRIVLKNGTEGEVAIKYGAFIQDIVNFLIIAFCVFLIITIISKLYKKKEETLLVKETPPSNQEILLAEIRDILKSRPSI